MYLIDFGYACQYNRAYYSRGGFRGNLMFCSRESLVDAKYYPKDDLESLVYVLQWLLTGELPWCKRDYNYSSKYVRDLKKRIKVSEILNGLPDIIVDFFNAI